MLLGTLLLASPAVWGAAAPRFRFQVGKALTYHLNQTMVVTLDRQEALRVNLQTTTVLEPRTVDKDGTAEIVLTTTTTSRSTESAEPLPNVPPPPTEGPSTLIITVSPDGRITSAHDASGKPYHVLTSAEQQSEAESVWELLVGTRLLFSLQLPQTLPAVGATWQGKTTQETMATGSGKPEWQYSTAPVTYTYKGVEPYQGRPCHVFTALGDFIFPSTFYFDVAAGQLVGWEEHVEDPMTVDFVLRLAPSGKAAPEPETPAPSVTAPPTGAAPQPPIWKQANDWDITYRLLASPDRPDEKSGTLRVRVRRPNLMRIDATLSGSSTGTDSYTAVLDADSVRIYVPRYPLALWAPLNQHFPFLAAGLGGYGKVSPLPTLIYGQGPELVSPDLIAAAQRGEQALRLLPEETVAGRPALVVESVASASLFPGVGWVDKEYGLPLAGRLTHGAEFRAQEVHVNEGIGDAVFTPDMPPGTVRFKGPFGAEAAYSLSLILEHDRASEVSGRIPKMESFTTPSLLALPRLPADFGNASGQDTIGGGTWWRVSTTFASRTGAVITFVEQSGLDDALLRSATAGLAPSAHQTSVTVHSRPATLYQHDRPYPGLILVWEEKGLRGILQATDVPADELLTIANSVVPLEVTAQKEVVLPDLETALSVLPAPVYQPTDLPAGAKVVSMTAKWLDSSDNGPAFTTTYALPQGGSLAIQQRWPFVDIDSSHETPGGKVQSVTWEPEGEQVKVVVSGPLTKDALLTIAQSMKPVPAAAQ